MVMFTEFMDQQLTDTAPPSKLHETVFYSANEVDFTIVANVLISRRNRSAFISCQDILNIEKLLLHIKFP